MVDITVDVRALEALGGELRSRGASLAGVAGDLAGVRGATGSALLDAAVAGFVRAADAAVSALAADVVALSAAVTGAAADYRQTDVQLVPAL